MHMTALNIGVLLIQRLLALIESSVSSPNVAAAYSAMVEVIGWGRDWAGMNFRLRRRIVALYWMVIPIPMPIGLSGFSAASEVIVHPSVGMRISGGSGNSKCGIWLRWPGE